MGESNRAVRGDLKIGDFVIMNDLDRPEAAMIAKIIRFDSEERGVVAVAKYICNKTARSYGLRTNCRQLITSTTPTKIEDFGVYAVFANHHVGVFKGEMYENPIAKYKDGSQRKWQGTFDENGCEYLHIRTDFWE